MRKKMKQNDDDDDDDDYDGDDNDYDGDVVFQTELIRKYEVALHEAKSHEIQDADLAETFTKVQIHRPLMAN